MNNWPERASNVFFRVLAFVVLTWPIGLLFDITSAVLIARREGRGTFSHFWYELRARRGIIPYSRV